MTEKKKIIIDEDWKSQVEAEREQLKRDKQESPESATGGQSDATAHPTGPLPPASFDMLITSLATESMMFLGQIPDPSSGEARVNLEQARYTIDMLEMLSEKTKGNLTSAEEQGLGDILHQLRMAFVAVKSQVAGVHPSS